MTGRDDWHLRDAQVLASEHGVDTACGLDEAEVGVRALRHGANELTSRAGSTWLGLLAVHPYYKGGQFLFDLLEWEDFMLDGEPPLLLDEAALAAALARLADLLRRLGAALGQPVDLEAAAMPVHAAATDLPPLRSSMYLFPDVVLGVLGAAAAASG